MRRRGTRCGQSRREYGVDLYPEGPLSAYRTYAQLAELYREYLNGTGGPAAPPGTSDHNLGIALDWPRRRCGRSWTRSGRPSGWAKGTAPKEWWHITYVGR